MVTPHEVLASVNGESVNGKLRYRVGREYIVIATAVNGEFKFTPEGQKMANELNASKKPAPKTTKSRKTTKPVVESN